LRQGLRHLIWLTALNAVCVIAVCVILGCADAHAQSSAPESGACSLEQAAPVTVARIEAASELLLNDGRRIVISALDIPQNGADSGQFQEKARQRLSAWLTGRQAFLAPLALTPDRWGRIPARVFASRDDDADSPLVGVGETLLEEGLARFRPDRAALICAPSYLTAESVAREKRSGVWGSADFSVINAEDADGFHNRKGMIVAEGAVRSIGESGGLFYLNFGPRRGVDFAVVILKRNLTVLERSGVSPKRLGGQRVRIRGMIETGNGLRIEVANPAEIQVVGKPR
jgi:endonuclease YncB( thermonuclease family)